MNEGQTYARAPNGEAAALADRIRELELEVAGLRAGRDILPRNVPGTEVLEALEDGFAMFDAAWRFTYVNGSAERLLGRTGESLLGRVFWQEYPALLGTESELVARRVMTDRTPGDTETYYAPLNGWFEGRFFPAPDGGVFVLFRNITERKLAEQASKASEQRWHSLADAMPQFVWVSPTYGEAEFINHYWFEYTGLAEGDVNLASWTRVIHHEDMPSIAAMWQRAVNTGTDSTFEYRVKRASDGMWRWHLGFHNPVRDRRGEIVNWVGVAFDIHDRKLAEQALRNNEERQRLAVDAGAVGLWDWDIQTGQVDWSDRVYEFHGLSRETFGGTIEDFALRVHPADAERVRNAIAATLADDTPYDLTFRMVRPDGEVRWLTTRAQVIRDAQGKALRMVGATLDVTETKHAQQDLTAAKDALQSLIEHAPDGVFVADAAGRYVNVNSAACALLGYTYAELLGMSVSDLIRPEDRERQAQLITLEGR